jgi:hypothetical protein
MLSPDDGFDLRSLSLEGGGSAMSSDVYGGSPYYGQQQHGAGGSWQDPSHSQYGGSSYTGASSSHAQDYDMDEYYGNYDEYSQYQEQQNDPRYWGHQQ